jgi:Lipopolysaccharide kinase (Kdo/WaaP) family
VRPAPQIQWRADPNFTRIRVGRRDIILHREIHAHAGAILQRLGALGSGREAGAGNRQSAFRVSIADAPEMYARRSRRGGFIGSILQGISLGDIYLGTNPRPLRELALTVEAINRGVPVAEPMGAVVEWIGPVLYSGVFLTRAMRGMTLWQFILTDDDPVVRGHVLEQARAAIETMHSKGLSHADLNLYNLLVTQAGESFTVIILDLDKSRLYDSPLAPAMRRANLRRLARSARKLDPAGKYLDAAAFSLLNLE